MGKYFWDGRIVCILFGFQSLKAKGSVHLPSDPPYPTLIFLTCMVHQILQVLNRSVQGASPSLGVLGLQGGYSQDDSVCKSTS